MAIDDNTSYELTGRQVKDLANKVKAKADSASLASVATSGLYSDLTGAPTIPTVYNGTLTIQQNGTTVGTFTANSATDKTVNIDIHNGVMTADNLSPAADTTDGWAALLGEEGVYWTFYSQDGCFDAQPQTYGFLETIVHTSPGNTGWEIYQRWHSQSIGVEFYRSGNLNGWYNSPTDTGVFRKMLDDSSGVGKAITVESSARQTITTPSTAWGAGVVVSLTEASTAVDSNFFELYDGGVRVLKAGTYLVQANFMIDQNVTVGTYAILQTAKGTSNLIGCYQRSESTTSTWSGGALAAYAVEASANDVFYLRAAASQASYSFRVAGSGYTSLTVQKIA